MDLIYKYLGLYKDGMGGINSHGIITSFELERINKKVRPVYITKLIAFMAEMSKQQFEDSNTFKEDPNGKEH